MSTLTGNQIKDTYQGLLKLADSSTGITNSLQAVQDGLGNDTGLRISINQLESSNFVSFVPLKSRYYGSGFNPAAGQQYSNGLQNIILATPFLDNGDYDYSAITFNTTTITSTNDSVEAAIYSTQMINPFGLFPYEPIVSGITADTTTLGLSTYVFPSTISMSGYGGGVYWLVFKISNTGVQPTWRPGSSAVVGTINNLAQNIYGIHESFTTNLFVPAIARYNNTNSSIQVFSGLTTFDNPYANTIDTLQSTTINFQGNTFGFILHTTNS